MPFNGTGTFQRIYSWVTDAANGVLVRADRMDTDTDDIANGLSQCITKDGQTVITADIPMAGFTLTGLGAGATNGESVRYEQLIARTPLSICEGRLTLTTGVPVTTSDVTAAETLYWAPYKGNQVALYDGSSVWNVRTFTQLSIDVPDATSVYDVFVYDNAGTPALELTAWTNDTTRATALTTQDGVLVKTGALTRRYLGTFYSTTAGNGQIEDSVANRYLWNYYNRVRRPMRAVETANSWNYSTSTVRQVNANSANQLNFVIGVSEDMVAARCLHHASSSSVAGGSFFATGIGLDVTNAFTSGGLIGNWGPALANQIAPGTGELIVFPGVGKHFLAWLEYVGSFSGTISFYGDNNSPTVSQSGINGDLWG